MTSRKYFFLCVTLEWRRAVVMNRLHLYLYVGYFILALVYKDRVRLVFHTEVNSEYWSQ